MKLIKVEMYLLNQSGATPEDIEVQLENSLDMVLCINVDEIDLDPETFDDHESNKIETTIEQCRRYFK